MEEYGIIHLEDRRSLQSQIPRTEEIAMVEPGTVTQVEVLRTRGTLT
jgi:hypothetical protein